MGKAAGPRPIRIVQPLAIGLVILAGVFAATQAVNYGLTHQWSAVARRMWVLGMMVGGACCVSLLLGCVMDLDTRYPGEPRSLTVWEWASIHAMVVLGGCFGALAVAQRFGLAEERVVLGCSGCIFLWTATGRPWWLLAATRRYGWVRRIRSTTAMRAVLAMLGGGLLLASLR